MRLATRRLLSCKALFLNGLVFSMSLLVLAIMPPAAEATVMLGGSPDPCTVSLKSWLRPNDGTIVTNSATDLQVVRWEASDYQGNLALRLDNDTKPLLIENTTYTNGLTGNAIRFTNSNQHGQGTQLRWTQPEMIDVFKDTDATAGVNPTFTVSMAMKLNTDQYHQHYITASRYSGDNTHISGKFRPTTYADILGRDDNDDQPFGRAATVTVGEYIVITLISDGSTVETHMTDAAGNVLTTSSVFTYADDATFDINQVTLGAFHTGGGATGYNNFLQADVAEVLVYDTALNLTDRQAVETYLANNYVVPEPASLSVLAGCAWALRYRRNRQARS